MGGSPSPKPWTGPKRRRTAGAALAEGEVEASAGPEAWSEDFVHEKARCRPHEAAADPRALRILKVRGNSMEPELHEGDRIVFYTARRVSAAGELLVLRDGTGRVVKRVEALAAEGWLRLASAHSRDRPGDEVHLVGKVLWKVTHARAAVRRTVSRAGRHLLPPPAPGNRRAHRDRPDPGRRANRISRRPGQPRTHAAATAHLAPVDREVRIGIDPAAPGTGLAVGRQLDTRAHRVVAEIGVELDPRPDPGKRDRVEGPEVDFRRGPGCPRHRRSPPAMCAALAAPGEPRSETEPSDSPPASYQDTPSRNPTPASVGAPSVTASRNVPSMRSSSDSAPGLKSRQPAPATRPCSTPVPAPVNSRRVPSSPSSKATPEETCSARRHPVLELAIGVGEPESDHGRSRVAVVEQREPVAKLRVEAPGRQAVVPGAESRERGALEQRVRAARGLRPHGLGEAQGEPTLGPGRGIEGERPREAPLAQPVILVGQEPPGAQLGGKPPRRVNERKPGPDIRPRTRSPHRPRRGAPRVRGLG